MGGETCARLIHDGMTALSLYRAECRFLFLMRVRSETMSLDPKLLQVLACPKDKGPLEYDQERQLLVNDRLGIAYRVDDGIPVLLIDEAEPYTPAK